jgi:hypothetical protein
MVVNPFDRAAMILQPIAALIRLGPARYQLDFPVAEYRSCETSQKWRPKAKFWNRCGETRLGGRKDGEFT